MDYERSLCVLRSNAPAPREQAHIPEEVFRVTSGNERVSSLERPLLLPKVEELDDVYDGGSPFNGSNEHSDVTIIKREQQRKRRRERPATKKKMPDYWQGLNQAELQSERYLRYRKNQRQRARDSNGESQNIWPDHLEEAFQLALRVVPPVGRKKSILNGKQSGRNELISEKIRLWTGEDRDRKQVSSHIQVLKGFMGDNAAWMQHVTTPDAPTTKPTQEWSILHGDLSTVKEEDIDLLACRHFNLGANHVASEEWPPEFGMPSLNMPSQSPHLYRIEFEMFIVSPIGEKVHSYTLNQSEIGTSPRALEDIPDWRRFYPLLANLLEQNEPHSDIILIESSIDLLSDPPPSRSVLHIEFLISIAKAWGYSNWSSKTTYYHNNGEMIDFGILHTMDNFDLSNYRQIGEDVRFEVPLQSQWWVSLFHDMTRRKQETRDNHHQRLQEEEHSRQYLQELSIMQEIWATHQGDVQSPRRVAVLLWRFSQTQKSEAGITTWRRINPPPPRNKVNSPPLSPTPLLQQSLVLDSALREVAMPQPVSLHAERFLHSDIFTRDSEKIVAGTMTNDPSPSPTLSPDYTGSFPSSTSTSFPASVTYGMLSQNESQDSMSFSQEDRVYRQESFASQDSFASSQRPSSTYEDSQIYPRSSKLLSQESPFEFQDHVYCSQESYEVIPHDFLESPREIYHGHEPLNRCHNITQEFTGGKIQLSYQEVHESSTDATDTYIAPSIDTLQIDHRLEHSSGQLVIDEEQPLGPTSDDIHEIAPRHHHPAEFDFSQLETAFTVEELAAIQFQDRDAQFLGNLGQPQNLSSPTTEVVRYSQRLMTAVEGWEVLPERNTFNPPIEQHGAVLGEVIEEETLEREMDKNKTGGFVSEEGAHANTYEREALN